MKRAFLLATLLTLPSGAQGQPGKPVTRFPAEAVKEIRWHDALARGIQEAGRVQKPICLILAGRRPSGDC